LINIIIVGWIFLFSKSCDKSRNLSLHAAWWNITSKRQILKTWRHAAIYINRWLFKIFFVSESFVVYCICFCFVTIWIVVDLWKNGILLLTPRQRIRPNVMQEIWMILFLLHIYTKGQNLQCGQNHAFLCVCLLWPLSYVQVLFSFVSKFWT